ncbi:MAG: hypothetical protein ACKV19_16980, partial [Verrucomicrobiales bacterium]
APHAASQRRSFFKVLAGPTEACGRGLPPQKRTLLGSARVAGYGRHRNNGMCFIAVARQE